MSYLDFFSRNLGYRYRSNLFMNSDSRTVKRTGFIVRAVTNGVVPPDNIPADYLTIGVDPEVTKLAGTLKVFDKAITALPSRSDSTYDAVLEANSYNIWEYARDCATDLVSKNIGYTGAVAKLMDHTKYAGQSSNPYTSAIKNCKKVFARGKWKNFWAAISVIVQDKRDLQQRIPSGLDIKAGEYTEVINNMIYCSQGFAWSSRTTQSKTYIEGTSRKQKLEDREGFEKWKVDKILPLVKIIRMNISDIPLGYAVDEIQAFEADPTNVVNVNALEATLLKLQKEGLEAWRNAKTAGQAWSYEDWIALK